MKEVLVSNLMLQAEMARARLEDAGIPSLVRPVRGAGFGGYEKIYGLATPLGVYILRDEDYDEARELLSKPATGEPWTCPNCGLKHEGQFTQCWKCGASRDAPDGKSDDPNADRASAIPFLHECRSGGDQPDFRFAGAGRHSVRCVRPRVQRDLADERG